MNELCLNNERVKEICCRFIREEVEKAGFQRVIFGLSGGVDSSTVAFLAKEALGSANVWSLIMPYKESTEQSVNDAYEVVKITGIHSISIDITPMVDAYFHTFHDADKIRRGNKMARERMAILFDHSSLLGALVLGTSNKSELFLGYGTIYGDMASAINPIGDLYKSQVWGLASYLGVPDMIVKKQPSADLWVGQTDEDELGFTYREVDRLLYFMIDKEYNQNELIAYGFDREFIRNVSQKIESSQYKRRLPIIAKFSGKNKDTESQYA